LSISAGEDSPKSLAPQQLRPFESIEQENPLPAVTAAGPEQAHNINAAHNRAEILAVMLSILGAATE